MTTRAWSRMVSGGRLAPSFALATCAGSGFGEAAREARSAGEPGVAGEIVGEGVGVFCALPGVVGRLGLFSETTLLGSGDCRGGGLFDLKTRNDPAATAMMAT